MNADTNSVLIQLQALEPLIYAANDGKQRTHFERLLAPEFWEVGASGKVYDRTFVLDALEARQASPREEAWHARDYRLEEIAPHHFLLTYLLDQPTRRSRRATIWQHTAQGWTMRYHQGTVVEQAAAMPIPTSTTP